MNEMVAYIFASLRSSENSIKIIKRSLRNQMRINRGVAMFSLTMAIYVILSEINNLEQNRKIEKLSKELEELKRLEGE